MIRLFAALTVGIVAALLFGGLSPADAAPAPSPAPGPAPSDAPPVGKFVIPSGPLDRSIDENDRVFLEKVRQAGLWEIPAGEMAQKKGASERVRDIGPKIAADHVQLDEDVRNVAKLLGVALPDNRTALQDKYISALENSTGEAFDEAFANSLRYAHGAVYGAIAQERAGTRNSLMRLFATHCEKVVHRHMLFLESTGKVKYDNLPPAVVARGNLRADEKKQPIMLIGMLVVAGAIGIAGVTRVVRGAV